MCDSRFWSMRVAEHYFSRLWSVSKNAHTSWTASYIWSFFLNWQGKWYKEKILVRPGLEPLEQFTQYPLPVLVRAGPCVNLKNFSLHGFSAQLIGPIQFHAKRHISRLCIFFQDNAWIFSAFDKICHSPFKKVKRHRPWESHFLSRDSQKFKLKSHWRHTLPGELAGESVTK